MPIDPGILTKLLNTFTFVFTGGYATMMPEALWLLQTLTLIEFTLFALYMALGAEDAVAGLITKLMWSAAFIFLVTLWPTLTKIVVDSFMQVGLQAGSNGARLFTVMEFTNRSSVARFGLEVNDNLFG